MLSDREQDVLALVARGLSNSEIATELFITLATVKTHVSRLVTKLGARDRAQLIVIAYESGFATRLAPHFVGLNWSGPFERLAIGQAWCAGDRHAGRSVDSELWQDRTPPIWRAGRF